VLNQKQRAFWRDLNEFIRLAGGFIVSQPDISPIRFECQPDSTLPTLLREAGHRLLEMGSHQRLVPSVLYEQRGRHRIATTSVSPGIVSVWQLELTDRPKPPDDRHRVWTAERLRQLAAERRASKPPPSESNDSPEPALPKPENQRWKETPSEIKRRVEDELRAGTRSRRIAQMFSVSPRTISRIKATMDR